MRACRILSMCNRATLACALAIAAACSGEAANDPNHRAIAWTYGPTQGGATEAHLLGTGAVGEGPVAKGWQLRLEGGKTLSVKPFVLAPSHALFDDAVLIVNLFDRSGEPIGTERSGTIRAGQASFTFDLAPAVAQQLWDVVIWYAKA
jgi:hypothetical protein